MGIDDTGLGDWVTVPERETRRSSEVLAIIERGYRLREIKGGAEDKEEEAQETEEVGVTHGQEAALDT